jgi:hypothetical protein
MLFFCSSHYQKSTSIGIFGLLLGYFIEQMNENLHDENKYLFNGAR